MRFAQSAPILLRLCRLRRHARSRSHVRFRGIALGSPPAPRSLSLACSASAAPPAASTGRALGFRWLASGRVPDAEVSALRGRVLQAESAPYASPRVSRFVLAHKPRHSRCSLLRLCRLRRHARSRSHVRFRPRLRLLQPGGRSGFVGSHRGASPTLKRARREGGFCRRNPLPTPHRECHGLCWRTNPATRSRFQRGRGGWPCDPLPVPLRSSALRVPDHSSGSAARHLDLSMSRDPSIPIPLRPGRPWGLIASTPWFRTDRPSGPSRL